ncbi:MAG: hypothetical protein JF602_10015 [Gemmatimonadetes bacterium]|nr:hypothetical protein [Gemmatimonadota bacterium]
MIADGMTLANPHLVITSLDTTRLRLTPSHDSLIAVRQGSPELELRLVASVITGNAPDTVQIIRVRP